MAGYVLIAIAVAVVFIFILVFSLFSRYKRCPSDKILVVYGKVGSNAEGNLSAKCIHGGAAFIWPIIQDYSFLDLTPMSIVVNLTNALSKQNIRVDVPSKFTVGISTEPGIMENAAERLLGLQQQDIHSLANDIILGQMRLVVAMMDIEEINNNRDKFLTNVATNVEAELKKIGLKLINVNITDIKDESGYIEALGKEAAAKAINEAKKSVAEQERIGEVGKTDAERSRDISIQETLKERDVRITQTQRDRDTEIALATKDKEVLIAAAKRDEQIGKVEAERDTRIKTAEANAVAMQGENQAKIQIANSDAERREKEAEALKRATAAEKVQSAKALEEAYLAEKKAEEARADRERAYQNANIVVSAEIEKQKAIIEAQAEAERIREKAKGEADAIYAKLEAEARGMYEILTKQAQGLDQIVKAAGNNPKDAVLLLISDKLPELVKMQTEAIKNIKIDKVTVWENGGQNGDGKSSTASFVSGLYKAVPPLKDIFNMAGMDLPNYLGKDQGGEKSDTSPVDLLQ
ncbi:flotillin family protein [Flavisolibacter tropicus]|uniref:Membrane protein n=1 Tax=Flavisolibacter tropicus TaxID=1492898 RepID=A0A172TSV3_9BACT|nr:flotillin family protein [Flavisolibacter tropicus]ANE50058.1 membrane protein [Flavisolibacter tropicus]